MRGHLRRRPNTSTNAPASSRSGGSAGEVDLGAVVGAIIVGLIVLGLIARIAG